MACYSQIRRHCRAPCLTRTCPPRHQSAPAKGGTSCSLSDPRTTGRTPGNLATTHLSLAQSGFNAAAIGSHHTRQGIGDLASLCSPSALSADLP
eukprot:UN2027